MAGQAQLEIAEFVYRFRPRSDVSPPKSTLLGLKGWYLVQLSEYTLWVGFGTGEDYGNASGGDGCGDCVMFLAIH